MGTCTGTHRFFVADCAVVESEGTVTVIVVCTSCGVNQLTKHKVTDAGAEIKLENYKGKPQ
jgi:hypothetical protein